MKHGCVQLDYIHKVPVILNDNLQRQSYKPYGPTPVTWLQLLRKQVGRDSSVGIATRYGLDGPWIESRWGVRFSVPVQTGPGAHPASFTTGTGSFPGVKQPGGGVDHPPLSSAEVKERVELYFYSLFGSSWPVLGWTLRKQTNSGTSTALTADHTDIRAHDFAHSSYLWHYPKLPNITCAWSWGRCEIILLHV